MRKLLTLILLITALMSKAQVDQALKRIQLYEGSEYVTYGHRITEVFSELEFHFGVGIFPKTNIAYLTYRQLVVLMQDTAKRENWTQERYLESRNYFRDHASGGRIVLYVERYGQYETNRKLFFVIVRNKNEEELKEIQFTNRPPDFITNDLFSNWAYIDLDVEMPDEFFVYVNHKLTDHLSDTKFLVEVNAAPLLPPTEEKP
ncbi:MAG: hypothetical protein JEZ09_05305 [Salinivirgaceae bacterium]|nr:hypothetical protein [Salinivirgaceae bacterium]